jgi:ferredoxin
MAHVVTERCVDCRYTDCCAVCPVDCFYEVTSPAMLVIDPDVCIDCELCVPECPIQAIWPEDELPEVYRPWTKKNAELFGGGTRIKIKKDALPAALPLAQIQARERERGWEVEEPKGAGGGEGEGATEHAEAPATAATAADSRIPAIPTPAGLADTVATVYQATANSRYRWRTVRSVALQARLPQGTVEGDLEKLVTLGHVKKQPPKTIGAVVYGAVARLAS